MAVLKRASCSSSASVQPIFVCLPRIATPLIHCIRVDDLHEDLFTPRDEDFYASTKLASMSRLLHSRQTLPRSRNSWLQGIESMQTAGRPETPTHIVGGVASSSSMNPPTKACDDDPDEPSSP